MEFVYNKSICFIAQSIYRYLAQNNPWIAQIHSLRITAGESMECATNLYFVAQSIDRYFAQDNPWIAQIHTLRITYTLYYLIASES